MVVSMQARAPRCHPEPAAGEGSLPCVISSVARNFSERFLGPTNTVGPRNDKESAIGGRALRPPTLARRGWGTPRSRYRSEEHTSELQSRLHLVCRLLLEKKKNKTRTLPSRA